MQEVPRETPVKEDSIIDLLQSSEIEFNPCHKVEKPKFDPIEFDISFDTNIEIKDPVVSKEPIDIENILQNSELDCSHSESVEQFETGFGENHDLYFESQCKHPELKTPLYAENYLNEFVSEEDKAAARHALGLYNKEDVVAMSLLTAENKIPAKVDWENIDILQLRKGDKFFAPFTSFDAVFDRQGNSLQNRFAEVYEIADEQRKALGDLFKPSNSTTISSLGDVRVFLQGFDNGDNLHTIIEDINQEMLRFEKTGQM